MTSVTIQPPIYGIKCDGPGCIAEFVPEGRFAQGVRGSWGARSEAMSNGWKVRPGRGTGSRTAPDLCPNCRDTDGGESA